jgi:Ran GTPase-activating protein (RanGAP) involved in mRNA processing and transport
MTFGINCVSKLATVMLLNKKIAHLNLRFNILKDAGASVLGQVLQRTESLIHLDISQNCLLPKGCASLLRSLLKNNSVCSLALGNYENTNKNRLGEEGLEALVQLLVRSSILMFLDIRSLVLGQKGTTRLSRGLKASRNLVYLNLSKNEITSASMTELVQALNKHQLADLDLSQNAINDSGVACLSRIFLSSSTALLRLNLSCCRMTSNGALQLFDAVSTSELQELNISRNFLKTPPAFWWAPVQKCL